MFIDFPRFLAGCPSRGNVKDTVLLGEGAGVTDTSALENQQARRAEEQAAGLESGDGVLAQGSREGRTGWTVVGQWGSPADTGLRARAHKTFRDPQKCFNFLSNQKKESFTSRKCFDI